jgi:hypothetical protein
VLLREQVCSWPKTIIGRAAQASADVAKPYSMPSRSSNPDTEFFMCPPIQSHGAWERQCMNAKVAEKSLGNNQFNDLLRAKMSEDNFGGQSQRNKKLVTA